MRVITWNVRKAKLDSKVWELLIELNADIILLQEVVAIPKAIRSSYKYELRKAINKKGSIQKFGTAVLTKGDITDYSLSSEFEWVNKELAIFNGNLVACTVHIINKPPINVVSVYSPAWPISKDRLMDVDVSTIKLKLNNELWCTEILWSALKNKSSINEYEWIVGGDFNSSETFDYLWKGGPRGNLEIIERMNMLGFAECLRGFQKKLTPTFKNARDGKLIHQIDHLYVSDNIYQMLSNCIPGDSKIIFDEFLSDHLPIIADFTKT